MVKIRLMRVGKRKQPSYRIVVMEGTDKQGGRAVATIGHYNPLAEPAEVTVDTAAALSWLNRGAQPSPAARRILAKSGVLKAWGEARSGREGAPGEGDAG
ncbi:MAG: 30S ribosomal protein S16 [Candidatus Bipolaricaulota bacterium]|nr:30S ribosomal protein S16 [Candidatus Bipolaricaulota bacterium]